MGLKLARCLIATELYTDALATLKEVSAQDKRNIAACAELANLLKRMDEADKAEAVLDQMINDNKNSADAYVARARYRQAGNALAGARSDIERAQKLAPKSLEVLLASSELAAAEGSDEQALKWLNLAQSLYPDNERVYKARASASRGRDPRQAEADLKKIKDPGALFSLIDIQLRKGDVPAAQETIKKMRAAGCRPELLRFYEAQILMVQRRWREARYALERVRTELTSFPPMCNRADMLLGLCYDQLGLPDQQLVVYRRLLEHDSTQVGARLGYALALLRTGQVQQALVEYRKLRGRQQVKKYLDSPTVRASLFQLMMVQAVQVPEEERDWTELEEFLADLEGMEKTDKIQLALMQANLMIRKGQLKQARKLIQAKCDENPTHATLWSTLATLVAMDEGPQKALAFLAEIKDRLGDGLRLRLMQAALAVRLGREEGEKTLSALADDVAGLSDTQKAQLWQRLGVAYYALGNRETARQYWKRATGLGTGDPRIQLALFELAWETGDTAGMVEAAEAIHQQLGSRSAEWNYCEAARLVWLIRRRQMDRKSLIRAKQHLREAKQTRPIWYRLLRLEGEIAVMEGRPEDAVKAYQQASELGPLRPAHLIQLVQLLCAQGRYEEAKSQLDKLGGRQISPLMNRIRVELDERTGELDRALELAAQTMADSDRATDFLWYGELLARAGKIEQAETALRRALQLDPRIPDAWLALVTLLAKHDKTAEAEQVVRDAQSQLPEDQTPLVLARCYEKLGRSENAEQYYVNALSLHPDDLSMIRRIVLFYMRGKQFHKAGKYLGQMIQVAGRDPDKHQRELVWARRRLARVLALSGDYRHHRQALALLDRNASGGEADESDLRLKAAILAKRPERRSRQEAIELLEGLHERLQRRNSSLSTKEQLLLAGLYESTNRWSQCQERMVDLLARNAKDAPLLATYLQMLFRHGSTPGEIKPWLNRLQQLKPDSPVTIGMRARLLDRSRQKDEAVKLLKSLIPRPLPPEQVARLKDVAGLLEELRQVDEARELLTEFAEKAPGGSIVLAAFLARHGTVDEALDQCEAAMGSLPPDVVLPVAVRVLGQQRANATPQQVRRVEGWIHRALDEDPRSKNAQLQRARLLDFQGQSDELIRCYRAFLLRDDISETEKATVWNNLAFVLAITHRDGKEALEMVNKAVAVLGPLPNLLDTRAMAYLAMGQGSTAVEILLEAIGDTPTGVRYFHLALAHAAAGNLPAAGRALQVGRDSHELSEDQVPTIERQMYRELVEKIESH